MRKSIHFIACICMVTMLFSNIKVFAASSQDAKPTSEMSMDELAAYFNVAETAEKYGADSEELLNAIYDGIHSNKFSPFSQIECTKLNEEGSVLTFMRGDVRTSIAYDQDSTMYLETGDACASGVYPYIGCVAVHKKSTTDAKPILPFGTTVHYEDNSVNMHGMNYETFTVEDTGDRKFVRSTYWTDVYGGANNDTNRKMAAEYGIQKVSITWW